MTGAERTVVLRGCRLFDGVDPPDRSPATVMIRGDRIEFAGRRSAAPPVPDSATVVDAEGLTAMPGLIDLHNRSDGRLELTTYIRAGVTTVRLSGIDAAALLRLRRTAQQRPAPRLLSCGPLIDAAPASWPTWSRLVSSAASSEAAARALLRELDLQGLMVAQNITAVLLAPIIAVAREHAVPVIGQTWALDAAEAARLGVDELENTSRIFSSSLWPRRGPPRFAQVAERIAYWAQGWASVDWDLTMRQIDAMVQHDVAYCPTLAAHYWWTDLRRSDLEEDPLFPLAELEELTDNQVLMRDVEQAWTRELKMEMRAALGNREEWLRRFHGAGGRIVAGTDTRFGGVMLHAELRYLADAGIPPLAALRAATSEAARCLRRDDLGRLAPGCRADVLLVEGDPTEDLAACRRLHTVIRAGEPVTDAVLGGV